MRFLKISVALLFVAAFLLPSAFNRVARSQSSGGSTAATDGVAVGADQANRASETGVDVTDSKAVDHEGAPSDSDENFSFSTTDDPAAAAGQQQAAATQSAQATSSCWIPFAQAPADFDDVTNGFTAQAVFDADKNIFDSVKQIKDGLGPVYNAQSCRECHQNPVTGAASQVNEMRAGRNDKDKSGNTIFVDAPGGSLINDRSIPTKNSINPPNFGVKLQERIPPLFTAGIVGGGGPILEEEGKVRAFRLSLNVLGDGFVEAVPSGTLLAISFFQPFVTGGQVHGQVIAVPVLEANINTNPDCGNPNLPCVRRVARFGWKNQHASLLSFSGDAFRNEMGITNFLIRTENTSLGRSVAAFDPVPDPLPNAEDAAQEFQNLARFMRATKAPPRDPDIINSPAFAADVDAGRKLFSSMPPVNGGSQTFSCSVCHVPAMLTAPPCTSINGGQFTVPAALGNKIIRPFSDFLLHDVGTGDGIVQNGGQSTRLKIRTPPLWGLRARTRLMHDGLSLTFKDAIQRHAGEATSVVNRFNALTPLQQQQLITFLETL